MEESTLTEPLDYKEPLLSKIMKEELSVGDEALKEDPYQDEFKVKEEMLVEEGISQGAQDFGLTPSKDNRGSNWKYGYTSSKRIHYDGTGTDSSLHDLHGLDISYSECSDSSEPEGEANLTNENFTSLISASVDKRMSQPKKTQWDYKKDKMLIELVKSKPELYDLTSPFYSDNVVKRRDWVEINKQLGCEGCKERWESLRSQYRKHLSKATKSGQVATSTVKWRYEEQLGFLRSLSKVRTRISSMQSEEADKFERTEDDTEQVADENEAITVHVPVMSAVDEVSDAPVMSAVAHEQPRQRKRKKQPTSSASAMLMTYLLGNMKQSADPIDTFFQSMASTVKKFNPTDQLLVKSKLFSLVTEIEAKYIKS